MEITKAAKYPYRDVDPIFVRTPVGMYEPIHVYTNRRVRRAVHDNITSVMLTFQVEVAHDVFLALHRE